VHGVVKFVVFLHRRGGQGAELVMNYLGKNGQVGLNGLILFNKRRDFSVIT
jgi:hypothetical protein